MSNTRREFIQTSAALAVGMMSGAATLTAEQAAGSKGKESAVAPAEIQVPKIKFGNVEISRMVLGHNQFCGFSHFSTNLSKDMTTWYTQDEVCAVMHRANSYGINAYNYSQNGSEPDSAKRAADDWARFIAEGGKMYVIAGDGNLDPAGTLSLVQTIRPWRCKGMAWLSMKPFTLERWTPLSGSGASAPAIWASWSAWVRTIPR